MKKRAPILPIIVAILIAVPIAIGAANGLPASMDKYKMIIFFLALVLVGGALIFLIGRLGNRRR